MKKVGVTLISLLVVGCSIRAGLPLRSESNTVPADDGPRWTKVETPLTVYHHKTPTNNSDYASAEGFWQSTSSSKDKQSVFPIAIKISCDRYSKTCREAEATVAFGVLKPDLIEFAISSWTDSGIVADDTDEGSCSIGHRLSIDFKSNSVTVTDYSKKVSDNPLCKGFQDATSYVLQGGELVLYPPALWDPLAKSERKK
jgi:hypothetical protein